MGQDLTSSQHFALHGGLGIVFCLGVRDGDRVIPPALIEERVKVDGPSHLSISCLSGATYCVPGFHIDVRVTMRSPGFNLSVRAGRFASRARIVLLDSQLVTQCAVPIVDGTASLGELDPAEYSLILESAGSDPHHVGLTLEPFSVADAIDAGIQCFHQGRFRSALAVFGRTLFASPESQTLIDFVNLTRILLAGKTPLPRREERLDPLRTGDGFHLPESAVSSTESLLRSEELSHILSVSADISAAEWRQLMEAVASRFSLAMTSTLEIFRGQITTAVRSELQSMTARLEDLDIRSGKMHATQERLEETIAAIPWAGPEYAPRIKSRLGTECTAWLGDKIFSDIVKAEELYRQGMNVWVTTEPDFKLPLFSLLGALEALILDTFDATFDEVRRALDRHEIAEYVRRTLTIDIAETTKVPVTLGRYPSLCTAGKRIVHRWKGQITPRAAGLIVRLCDQRLVNPLKWLSRLRNSIAHNARTFSAREMLSARKLVLGLDELKIRMEDDVSLSMAHESQSPQCLRAWDAYPGVIPLLWTAAKDASS